MAEEIIKSPWMEITLDRQLADERNFPGTYPVELTYGVLCGHRMGSNLLTESLHLTGVMGDPMEYFNMRWLKKFRDKHSFKYQSYHDFMEFLRSIRTSPNGVFGYNLKVDQLTNVMPKHFNGKQAGASLLRSTDKFIFLRRRDRLDQAISAYIGRMKDTFRIPSEADVDEIHKIVKDVQFAPTQIATILKNCIEYDKAWEQFLEKTRKPVLELYYEDMVQDFEGTIRSASEFINGSKEVDVPEQPTAKIAGAKNLELKQQFLDYIAPIDR